MKLSPEDLELWDFDLTLSAFKPVLRNGTTSFGRVVACYSIDLNELKRGFLQGKSMDWFLYDRNLRHEGVNDSYFMFRVNCRS